MSGCVTRVAYRDISEDSGSTIYMNIRILHWRTQKFCSGGWGGSKNSIEDRESGDLGGGRPIVRGSGGSCNLVQKNFFSYSKIFLIFGTLRLFMMPANLFVMANVIQLRT